MRRPEELRSSRATKDPQSRCPVYGGHAESPASSLLLLCLAAPTTAQDFWAHWGDGKAELNGYALKQPRYGAVRTGTSVLIFVTEEFSDTLRVKADPGKHPASDVYPVMKLNAVRDFSTGIYDYSVMTSAFLRVAPGWPVAKVSFSSQEWCGHVWHQVVPRDGKLAGLFHSYFDGEADGVDDLAFPKDGVFEDALPVLLRGWNGDYLKPGESRVVPFLPSLLWARLHHKPLAWTKATIARAASTRFVTVPAGRFDVDRLHRGDGGRAQARVRDRVGIAPPADPPDRPGWRRADPQGLDPPSVLAAQRPRRRAAPEGPRACG